MEMPPPAGGGGGGGSSGGKPDRKTAERIRRNQMNKLYSHLDSLVRSGSDAGAAAPPTQGGPAATTRPDRLGEAAEYIRRKEERVDMLREKKRELTGGSSSAATPEVEVQHLGSGLHAILVTGGPPNDGASFHRAVRAVEEAGGQVQNAHFSVVGAKAVYTIHAMVGEGYGGIERVVQRLKEAIRSN
uniref:BHLH domain-containing protein n=1 Tax=Oryza punctata TaxID=4537 RepID=A0A0E0JXP7_ORYPU